MTQANGRTSLNRLAEMYRPPSRSLSAVDRQRWRKKIFQIYARMRRRATKGPYEIQCDEIDLVVFPNVYAPKYFTDSVWFAQQLPMMVGNASLLEIGTGTGLIAIACARKGARVVATDINPDAVQNAQVNIANHRLDIRVVGGNLFDELESTEKFEYIFWAHPFNSWERTRVDMLLRSGIDCEYEALSGYFERARRHLTHHGKLLLGTGDSADLERVFKIAGANGYRPMLRAEAEMPLEEHGTTSIRYLVYEFVTS